MPEMTIRLQCDPATGKKNIIVSLKSDEDTLPLEHEQQHRALVEKLLERGLLNASDVGQIVVEREEEAGSPAPVVEKPAEPERQSQAQGN